MTLSPDTYEILFEIFRLCRGSDGALSPVTHEIYLRCLGTCFTFQYDILSRFLFSGSDMGARDA